MTVVGPREELELILHSLNLGEYMEKNHQRIVQEMSDAEINKLLDQLTLIRKRNHDQLGHIAADLLETYDELGPR